MEETAWQGRVCCENAKGTILKASEIVTNEFNMLCGSQDSTKLHEMCSELYTTGKCLTIKHHDYYDSTRKEINFGRLEHEIVSFICNGVSNQMRQKVKTSQEAGFGVNVQIADDYTFADIVASPTFTFVMFYASWCSNCRPIKPPFSRLATALKSENWSAQAIAVDVSENAKVADIAQIEIIPMFKLFKSGKAISTYEGNRSFEDMINFIKVHTVKDLNTSNIIETE